MSRIETSSDSHQSSKEYEPFDNGVLSCAEAPLLQEAGLLMVHCFVLPVVILIETATCANMPAQADGR